MFHGMRPTRVILAASLFTMTALSACGSISIRRDTQTSGTYEAKGFAVTFLSWDIPQSSEQIARENASDARLTNTLVTDLSTVPNLGWFDWIFDILGLRWTTLKGTWGFLPDPTTGAAAK